MQTFVTHASDDPIKVCNETFRMLDRARLGKQRVEVLQLLSSQFPNHPASKMWGGHHHALTAYGILCCKHWVRRGHDDAVLPQLQSLRRDLIELDDPLVWPWWFGHPAMVRTHQSKLYHKGSPRWVERTEATNNVRNAMRLPYLWPDVNEEDVFRISVAEAKRGDWEIPTSWSYDVKTRMVIPR